MISVMLQKKMKKKSDSEERRPRRARRGPIVCMTMPSSMKSTEASATLRTPFGATIGSLRPATQ